MTISNVREEGSLDKPDDAHALFIKGNTFWHTDSSFKRLPAKASLYHVPRRGAFRP